MINKVMKISEIESIKPKTPEQIRLDALKKNKDKTAEKYKAETERQKKQKARQQITKAQKIPSIPSLQGSDESLIRLQS